MGVIEQVRVRGGLKEFVFIFAFHWLDIDLTPVCVGLRASATGREPFL
jgi:hypothetical protein